MPEIQDYNLAIQIKEGNKQAFDRLFLKYFNPLYRYAFNLCKNKAIAEDSVQQTFIKIWKNTRSIPTDIAIGKILFTYTHNQMIVELRKENARKKYEDSLIQNSAIYTFEENKEDKQRTKAIIESAIDKLPEKSKEMSWLAKQEGLTHDEIAEDLKISPKTVENQLGNAYKKLREYLNPYKEIL